MTATSNLDGISGKFDATAAFAADSVISRAGAVIVFFNPDRECIENANRLASILKCVVVDNSDSDSRPSNLAASVAYLPQGMNTGVAAALNRGIEWLRSENFAAAMLFDQDSCPTEELVNGLASTLFELVSAGEAIAAVGPAYWDERFNGVTPFVRFSGWRMGRVEPSGQQVLDVDFLITSGTCINISCWTVVGPMEEALFIDYVDLEWCVRAKRRGLRLVGVPWLRLSHSLGGEPIRIFGRCYPSHSPFRHYFMFRNAILLIRRSEMPWPWRLTELLRLPVRFIIYSTLMTPRLAHARASVRGIVHGIMGRAGPF
ncbi:glycosyltransferase family 2 protein [Paraburkholderia sp. GAS333]|uniref:glycosyltransferase family 2 protein n=1 Tax=Paraburkholderia sp. GAS333 TaxID=3156279 RepID=UPI003D22A4CF